VRYCAYAYNLPVERREAIQESVEVNGGVYGKDLTKGVTHLVAAVPQGAKYDRAKQWGMKVVSTKWLEESLQRRMVLDEKLYDPLMPVEQQGQGAFVRDSERRTSPSKRSRDEQEGTREDAARRKMRRTASTRLNSQSQGLWADMSLLEQETHEQEPAWTDGPKPSKRVLNLAQRAQVEVDDSVIDEKRPQSENIVERQPVKQPVETNGLFSGWNCLLHGHKPSVVSISTIAGVYRTDISIRNTSCAAYSPIMMQRYHWITIIFDRLTL